MHLVAGGFHLVAATDEEIEKIVSTLHDKWGVDYVAPGHCTGEVTFAALRRAFGERYLYAGLGTTIVVDDHRVRSSDRNRAGAVVLGPD